MSVLRRYEEELYRYWDATVIYVWWAILQLYECLENVHPPYDAPSWYVEEILGILTPLRIVFDALVFVHQSERTSGRIPVGGAVPRPMKILSMPKNQGRGGAP